MTRRMTMAQALVARLAAQRIIDDDGEPVPFCGGVFAIFGHGNVAGLGEALWQHRRELPVYRAHNEQAMAHAAIGYSKALQRRRIMAVTTSIGPGATNLVTAAATAHVNRLPILLLPGDVFASRAPDPVLQQVESFQDGTATANDTLRPVTRYFDRLMRPEQILTALPRALAVLTDPAQCGPVCLALPQDVQTEAFDCPQSFLHPAPLTIRRTAPDTHEFSLGMAYLRSSRRPLLIAGGGVLYSRASLALASLVDGTGIPVAETQAGKSSLPWDHPLQMGAIGVTGSPAANALAAEADLIIAVGSRLQDFTTGSNALFADKTILTINVQPLDGLKLSSQHITADAQLALEKIHQEAQGWRVDAAWRRRSRQLADAWRAEVDRVTHVATTPPKNLPYEAEVLGAIRESSPDSDSRDVVICAAGTLPAELHKLWRSRRAGSYQVEYGYSCMGYEIAAGLGAKMALPEAEVIVTIGDGSYLMLNSEIHTSRILNKKLIIVVLDNEGFGCIERLQKACGGASFNNMLSVCGEQIPIDFAAHAASLGAGAVQVNTVQELKAAMQRARRATHTQVLVIATTHRRTTEAGGSWWEVAVPEISERSEVQQARLRYEQGLSQRKSGVQKIRRETSVQKIRRKSGVQKIRRETGVQPSPRKSGVQGVPRKSGAQPSRRKSGVQKIRRETGVQKVQRKSGAQKIQRKTSARKARKLPSSREFE